jgi:replication factor A1
MSQPPKIENVLTEVLEVKAALVNIVLMLNEQREGLAAFGKALQDCVEVLQPPGHPLRADITPQQPVTQPVTPPTATEVVKAAQTAATVVQPVAHPTPAAAEKTGLNRIADLKDGDKKVNVTGKIVAVKDVRKTQTGKRVTEAVISDHTGTIKLSLWNEQIDLAKEDSIISIENGYVNTYQDKLILNIGLYGKLTVEAPP